MSKKKLQVENITNELEGASLFFTPSSPSPASITQPKSVPGNNEKIKQRQEVVPNHSIEDPVSGENMLDLVKPEPVHNPPTKKVDKKDEPTNDRSNERTNERLKKRTKVRQSFDIFTDQVMSLREISIEEEKYTGERVLLGDLAQQALDMLISKRKKK